MKAKLISITLLFSVIIIITTVFLYLSSKKDDPSGQSAEQIIALNEIEQLAKSGQTDMLSEKTALLSESIKSEQLTHSQGSHLFILCIICILFIVIVFSYIYFQILCPFDKMKTFAGQISQGNFNVPLNYERSNYFGEFTWAFDSMRNEITKARACEREAIDNNKTVIATLSHDIKTPISSIRAYAEGLEANLDTTPEKRSKYLNTIIRKCDEVSRLTNDLFLHSISDLKMLKISLKKTEICHFLTAAIEETAGEQKDIYFKPPEFTAYADIDQNRLLQVVENLINNSRKYAKSRIDISITKGDSHLSVCFRDYGEGILDEDIPFVFDKFYRGKNCRDEAGSGLGLYIVKYIMEQMNGKAELYSNKDGLKVTISLPLL